MQGVNIDPLLPKGAASSNAKSTGLESCLHFSEPQFSHLYNGSVILSQVKEIK